jgi:hypothetical protein
VKSESYSRRPNASGACGEIGAGQYNSAVEQFVRENNPILPAVSLGGVQRPLPSCRDRSGAGRLSGVVKTENRRVLPERWSLIVSDIGELWEMVYDCGGREIKCPVGTM